MSIKHSVLAAVLALVTVNTAVASGDKTPIKVQTYGGNQTHVVITSLVDEITIDHVRGNRGNCLPAYSHPKTLVYGQQMDVAMCYSPLLEFTVETSVGNFDYTMN